MEEWFIVLINICDQNITLTKKIGVIQGLIAQNAFNGFCLHMRGKKLYILLLLVFFQRLILIKCTIVPEYTLISPVIHSILSFLLRVNDTMGDIVPNVQKLTGDDKIITRFWWNFVSRSLAWKTDQTQYQVNCQ